MRSLLLMALLLTGSGSHDAAGPLTGTFWASPGAVSPAVSPGGAAGGGAPVVVDPPLVLLDASDLDSVTSPSDFVSAWASTGTSTTSATQGTGANQPAHTGTGSTAMLTYDGTTDFLAASASWVGTVNWHSFVVAKVNTNSSTFDTGNCQANNGFYTNASGTWGMSISTRAGTTYIQAFNYDGTRDCIETPMSLGATAIFEGYADGTNVGVALNGGAFTTKASGPSSTFLTQISRIGQANTGSFLDGELREFRYYARALTTEERDAVVAELQSKWGL